jgi:hypothetical protein
MMGKRGTLKAKRLFVSTDKKTFTKGAYKMAMFPTTESEILVLATNVKSGLEDHAEVFPTPPVTTAALGETLTALQAAMSKVMMARAAAEAATQEKLALLETLVSQVKKELRYAEDAVDGSDARLKLLGWSARRERVSRSVPGQARMLVVDRQESAALELAWMTPVEGGKVASYSVQRRLKSETFWTSIVSTYERRVTLTNQPRGVDLEYSVVATNHTGSGPVSNSVPVVL